MDSVEAYQPDSDREKADDIEEALPNMQKMLTRVKLLRKRLISLLLQPQQKLWMLQSLQKGEEEDRENEIGRNTVN